MNISGYLTTLLSFVKQPKKRKLIQIALEVKQKKGIEIGGPSSFFGLRGYCPVYVFANQVDGVNFSNETVWEGKIEQGRNYNYANGKSGFQYINEASDLSNITTGTYYFLLSCHSLEHIANPVKAMKEWHRVLKPGGTIILSLPDKNHTFDHKRPYTTFEHLMQDFKNNVDEHDATHFDEVYKFHDIEMDGGVQTPAELKTRTVNNFTNRCVHHHVYSLDLLQQLLGYCNFKTMHKQEADPHHLVIVAQK